MPHVIDARALDKNIQIFWHDKSQPLNNVVLRHTILH